MLTKASATKNAMTQPVSILRSMTMREPLLSEQLVRPAICVFGEGRESELVGKCANATTCRRRRDAIKQNKTKNRASRRAQQQSTHARIHRPRCQQRARYWRLNNQRRATTRALEQQNAKKKSKTNKSARLRLPSRRAQETRRLRSKIHDCHDANDVIVDCRSSKLRSDSSTQEKDRANASSN